MRVSVGAVALTAFLMLGTVAEAGTLIKRTQDPAVSPDGSKIAFVWQGDLWSVGTGGGAASRLSVHPANERMPVWTKDGKGMVFASDRYGNLDLFYMNADGSGLRRLTFDSSNEYPTSVAEDGMVYGYSSAWGRLDTFRVPMSGGDLVRVTGHPMEMEYYADVRKGKVLFNTAGSPGHWRKPGHKGANTAEVWVADAGVPLGNMRQVTKNEHMDLFPVFKDDSSALMVSNPDGNQNLYELNLGSGKSKKLTSFSSGTIRALTYSSAKDMAVYQKDSEIWVTDVKSGSSKAIGITAPEDARRNPVKEMTMTTGLGGMAVSPNGKRAVIEVRGELFLIPSGGGTTRQLTKNVYPDRGPNWLDDNTIVYTAGGKGGAKSIVSLTLDGQSKVLMGGDGDYMGATLSPDKKWIAFHKGDREIWVMPSAGGKAVKVFEGDFATAYFGSVGFEWSPDSEWISAAALGQRSQGNYLVKRDGSEVIEVARVGKGGSMGMVSSDGKFLVFSGTEGLDFDETRNSSSPMFVVDLVPQAVTFSEDDLDKIDEKPVESKDNSVKVVKEGLDQRKRKLNIGNVSGIFMSPQPGTVYANVDGQFSLVDLARGSARPVPGVTGPAAAIVAGGKTYISQRGQVSLLTPNGSLAPVRFSATMRVDMAAEELALFEEAWWTMDRMFYDPAMHGGKWAAVKTEYGAMVPYCTSRDDFYDLMDEMVERLDSSHQGATSPDPYRAEDVEQTGWLGVEWDWAAVEKGRYVVKSVYVGTPGEHPDMKLMPGDEVVKIDGVKPGSGSPLSEIMRGKSGRKVMLTVRRAGSEKEMAFKPLSMGAASSVSYSDWVNWNKKEVDRLSGGQLGYIHIQGMNAPSLDTFLVEIANELEGKKGVVVDVRYNGGGYTSHIILNIMRKEPWLIRTNRDAPDFKFSENMYRGNALEMPAVAMTNEYSFSNAEIFSEGFQRMGLGPVIGERTGGGVIGTYSFSLWDGGQLRLPASGAYTVDMENLENNGRKPTVNVDWDPVMWQNEGRDMQLERAVQELMKRVK